jgi:uridylate kinase
MNHGKPLYRRILLKLSGEALLGDRTYAIDPKVLDQLATEISVLLQLKVQIALVIGGGNFFRGEALSAIGIGRITGDQMGMLGTIMNALAMRDALERLGLSAHVMSAFPIMGISEHYDRRKAMDYLEAGNLVLFAGGTGNPLVTTDSAASLRAIEIGADILLKASVVDGVYSQDPSKYPEAERYSVLSYEDALSKELGVMDLTAFCQCRDHKMPIRVFSMTKAGALQRVVLGEHEGTLVH